MLCVAVRCRASTSLRLSTLTINTRWRRQSTHHYFLEHRHHFRGERQPCWPAVAAATPEAAWRAPEQSARRTSQVWEWPPACTRMHVPVYVWCEGHSWVDGAKANAGKTERGTECNPSTGSQGCVSCWEAWEQGCGSSSNPSRWSPAHCCGRRQRAEPGRPRRPQPPRPQPITSSRCHAGASSPTHTGAGAHPANPSVTPASK